MHFGLHASDKAFIHIDWANYLRSFHYFACLHLFCLEMLANISDVANGQCEAFPQHECQANSLDSGKMLVDDILLFKV